MIRLLSDAVGRLADLPEADQEFYARQLLRELDADERWNELFTLTTDAQWSAMVNEAREDADANGTMSLDDLRAAL